MEVPPTKPTKGADMSKLEFTPVQMPRVWNAEKDFTEFSKAVTENQFALAKRLDQLIALQEQQNELLQRLVQGQQAKD